MRVLIAIADSELAMALAETFDWNDIHGECTIDGAETIQMLGLYDYDIAIVDADLGAPSGLELIRKARSGGIKTPIILLSGGALAASIEAFDAGADDVLSKPFHGGDLMARINAIVRRSKGHAQSVIITGDLFVNINQKTVEVDGVAVHLTGKEYQILELLSLRKGTTLTKEMFLNHLYGGMDEPELKIIDVFICKIRKKLAMASHGRNYIETVWGRGYVLRDPIGCPLPPLHKPPGVTKAMIAESKAKGDTATQVVAA